ncbi:MAG TPA: zf-HC2 domain-containing protein [Thermoanaerobaculia bacterium]|nr:zf-HC2 domain-containing protein [Thermoanaerobaculia bacterium]
MNHSEAIETQAAESYLLGELDETTRESFEEHFFDCRVCAETVRAGATMFATGREVVKQEPQVRRFRPMKWIASTAVATAAATIVAYQGLIIPRMQTAPIALIEPLTLQEAVGVGDTRAEGDEHPLKFENDTAAEMSMDVPLADGTMRMVRYRVELRDASGKAIRVLERNANQVGQDNKIRFLLRPLPAGRYVLVLVGVREDGNRSELSSANYVVE